MCTRGKGNDFQERKSGNTAGFLNIFEWRCELRCICNQRQSASDFAEALSDDKALMGRQNDRKMGISCQKRSFEKQKTEEKDEQPKIHTPGNYQEHVYTCLAMKREQQQKGAENKIYDINVYTCQSKKQVGKNRLYSNELFAGACVDSGAELSVIGTAQAEAYRRYSERDSDIQKSGLNFKFCDYLCPSLGSLNVRLPTPGGAYIEFYPEVGDADVPMPIRLKVLERYRIFLYLSGRNIQQTGRQWKIPMAFKNGHIFIE